MTASVLSTELAMTTTVALLVIRPVVRMPSVRQVVRSVKSLRTKQYISGAEPRCNLLLPIGLCRRPAHSLQASSPFSGWILAHLPEMMFPFLFEFTL